MNPMEIGCAYSHSRAQRIIASRSEGGVILEDDARINDKDEFYFASLLFLERYEKKAFILSLSRFRQNEFNIQPRIGNRKKFIRLFGRTDLAVGYVATPNAASRLSEANSVIGSVADWPACEIQFFITPSIIVVHGDDFSTSTISLEEKDFRTDKNLIKTISQILFIHYFFDRPKSLNIHSYIQIFFLRRIYWRLDYWKLKLYLKLLRLV
jgi:GR25 family glycosyltransferase involved in LPS biosynthesis